MPGHAHAAIAAMRARYQATNDTTYLLSDLHDRSQYKFVAFSVSTSNDTFCCVLSVLVPTGGVINMLSIHTYSSTYSLLLGLQLPLRPRSATDPIVPPVGALYFIAVLFNCCVLPPHLFC